MYTTVGIDFRVILKYVLLWWQGLTLGNIRSQQPVAANRATQTSDALKILEHMLLVFTIT